MTTPPPILDQLRAAVTASGLSLRQVAAKADVAPIVVSRLMNGKTVTVETAESIGRGLGMTSFKIPKV
jgi:transcriptional regulator with XRE-family HTH domain